MLALGVGYHDVDGRAIVELVDFITTGEDRHVPAQKIDEYPFLRSSNIERNSRFSMARAAPVAICMTASFGEAVSQSGPHPFGYPQSWGDHRPKTSAKLICPSNKARIASSVRFVTP